MPYPKDIFAEHDDATDAVPGLRDGLTEAGVENEFFVYDGTEHALLQRDDRPEVYDEAAATTSMDRTVEFMMKHLS